MGPRATRARLSLSPRLSRNRFNLYTLRDAKPRIEINGCPAPRRMMIKDKERVRDKDESSRCSEKCKSEE